MTFWVNITRIVIKVCDKKGEVSVLCDDYEMKHYLVGDVEVVVDPDSAQDIVSKHAYFAGLNPNAEPVYSKPFSHMEPEEHNVYTRGKRARVSQVFSAL